LIAASKAGLWKRRPDGSVEIEGELLGGEDFTILDEAREGVVCQPLEANDAIVILDLAIDEALAHEGVARDVVRAVQQVRREAGLHVSDRIRLALDLPADWRAAAQHFRAYIAEQTLALELTLGPAPEGAGFSSHATEMSGESLRVALRRVS
jgi:isoleucyl-tRNA synthetase